MPVHAVGEVQISEKYESIKPYLNEKTRQIWAATEARAMGRGGVSEVARATGLSRTTIYKAIAELEQHETGLEIEVCHFPPGTSKWNKIEHQMFCHISQNWRGRPLTSRQVVINLINYTQTKQGLHIQAKLDKHHYKTKIKVTDDEFEAISLERDPFHGEWNYRIKSRE